MEMRINSNAVRKAAQAFWNRFRSGEPPAPNPIAGIGLALGGGFSRGMAHIGVLRVLEREGIPISWIAGVSAGSIVASAYASGSRSAEIEDAARSLKFKHVAAWRIGRLGLARSEKMEIFLRRTLKVHRFEDMTTPLSIVATDLKTGEPVIFQGSGEVFFPIRASCSYPGLFQPVLHENRLLVDGAISMEIPAQALRQLGVRHVVSVALPPPLVSPEPGSMFAVVNRCFQIMQRRTEQVWRSHSDLVIAPHVSSVAWDDFTQLNQLMDAGAKAAEAALPQLHAMLRGNSRPVIQVQSSICCAR